MKKIKYTLILGSMICFLALSNSAFSQEVVSRVRAPEKIDEQEEISKISNKVNQFLIDYESEIGRLKAISSTVEVLKLILQGQQDNQGSGIKDFEASLAIDWIKQMVDWVYLLEKKRSEKEIAENSRGTNNINLEELGLNKLTQNITFAMRHLESYFIRDLDTHINKVETVEKDFFDEIAKYVATNVEYLKKKNPNLLTNLIQNYRRNAISIPESGFDDRNSPIWVVIEVADTFGSTENIGLLNHAIISKFFAALAQLRGITELGVPAYSSIKERSVPAPFNYRDLPHSLRCRQLL